MLVLTC